MRLNLHIYCFTLIMVALTFTLTAQAQQIGHGDTTQLTVPASKSPFGMLGVPSELKNTDMIEGTQFPQIGKFQLRRDYSEEYRKYGLMRPDINLHLNYYNPQKSVHPALYALLLVGAFFNNRISTVQEEQYNRIMNNLYDYPTSDSRYGMTQYNISKGVFGRPDITVSGYRTFTPDAPAYTNPATGENHTNKPTPANR